MDGAVFADYPKRLAARGDFNHGPVLIGTAAHEADFYRTVGATKLDSAAALGLYMLSAYPTSWPALYALYTPASDAAANDSWERLTTDTWFRCPSRTLARALTAHGSQVYLYSFELAPAVHTQELDYVFDGPFVGPILTAPPLTASAPVPPHPGLVRRVQAYWTAFARTGDPNHDGGPAWPRYALATDPHLVLDDTISTGEGLDRQACDAWDRASASAPN
jgi:para-nitrobenzyl esterase